MKKINFIKTLSAKDQQSFLVWYEQSVLLGSLFLIAILVCQLVQSYTFVRVYLQYRKTVPAQISQQDLHVAKQAYEQRKQLAQKRLEEVVAQQKHFDSSSVVSLCHTVVKEKVSLQSLLVHEAGATCILQCAKSKDMIDAINTLKGHGLCKSIVVSHIKTVSSSLKGKNSVGPQLEATVSLTF